VCNLFIYHDRKTTEGKAGLEKGVNLTDKTIRVTWINQNIENGGRLISFI
jgi:hypothetical protein